MPSLSLAFSRCVRPAVALVLAVCVASFIALSALSAPGKSPWVAPERVQGPYVEQLRHLDGPMANAQRLVGRTWARIALLDAIGNGAGFLPSGANRKEQLAGLAQIAACAHLDAEDLVVEIGGGVLDDLFPSDLFPLHANRHELVLTVYQARRMEQRLHSLRASIPLVGGCGTVQSPPATTAPVDDALRKIARHYARELRPFAVVARDYMRSVHEAMGKARQMLRLRIDDPPLLTVSGGVSLGAYQAGFLYYYTEFFKQAQKQLNVVLASSAGGKLLIPPSGKVRPVRASGASAGSINAFLVAIASCQGPVLKPEKSWFWRIWTDIGLGKLLPASGVDDRGPNTLFSEAAIAGKLRELEQAWGSMPWESRTCQAEIAIPVTHTRARTVLAKASGGPPLPLPRAFEHFFLRLHVGEGPARFAPIQPPQSKDGGFHPVLGDGKPSVAEVFNLLAASAAFPVAFRERDVAMQVGGRPMTAAMRDGGMMDNAPVRLVSALSEFADDRQTRPPLLFLEPDAVAWSYGTAKPQDRRKLGLFADVAGIAGLYVGSLKVRDFIDHYGRSAKGRGRVEIPPRTHPVAGQHYANFSGFFERSFREADFYFGMLDAHAHLHRTDLAFRLLERSGRLPAIDSPTVHCLLAARQRRVQEDTLFADDPDDDEDDDVEDDAPNAHGAATFCKRLLGGRLEGAGGDTGRIFRASNALKAQLCTESKPGCMTASGAADAFFAALHDEGFVWREFGDGRALTAADVRARLRDVVDTELDKLAGRQPDLGSAIALRVGGRWFANGLSFRPPAVMARLGTGIGGGATTLRGTLAVAPVWGRQRLVRLVAGADAIARPERPEVLGGLTAGVEVSPLYLLGELWDRWPAAWWQLELGVGLSQQWSWREGGAGLDAVVPELWGALVLGQRVGLRAGWRERATVELNWRWLW